MRRPVAANAADAIDFPNFLPICFPKNGVSIRICRFWDLTIDRAVQMS